MTRTVGASVLFLLAASAGCGVGDDSGGDKDGDQKLGIICNATFKITGTFVAGTPGRPIDPDTMMPITGCWPVGVWTFQASMDTNQCMTPPALLPSYSFRVDRMDPDGTGYVESYTYLTDPSNTRSHVGVSAGGGADCEGGLELGSPDGTQYWNLKPMLGGTTINGFGEYALYKDDAWPWQ